MPAGGLVRSVRGDFGRRGVPICRRAAHRERRRTGLARAAMSDGRDCSPGHDRAAAGPGRHVGGGGRDVRAAGQGRAARRGAGPGRSGRGRRGGGVPVRRAAAAPDRGRLGHAARGAAAGDRSRRLRVGAVDAAFEEIGRQAGAGSQAARRALLGDLFARATAPEQRFLRQLLVGELRQGALEGVMVDAVAQAAGVPVRDVRRAVMLRGDLGAVAAAALAGGAAALAGFRLEVGRPVLPMLAQTADSVDAALAKVGAAGRGGVEARRRPDPGPPQRRPDVAVYTRSLDDITAPGAGGGGGRAGAAGDRRGARRGGDRAAPGRPAAAVPGDRVPGRQPRRPGRRCGRPRRCRRCCSTCCTSTAPTCWTRPGPSGRRRWPRWCPSRCGCRGSSPGPCRGVGARSRRRWTAGTKAWWSSRSPRRTRPVGAGRAG